MREMVTRSEERREVRIACDDWPAWGDANYHSRYF